MMGDTTRAAAESITLTALEMRVLVVLAAGERHGYGIAKQLERLGGPSIYPANLYRHLHKLVERRLIEPARTELDESGRARKLFRATELGLEAVRLEGARLRGMVDELDAALAPGSSE